MYFLGIDGGGTSTKFSLIDENVNIIESITTGTSHYNQVGFENVGRVIKKGIDKLLDKSNLRIDDISYTYIGMAGLGKVKETNRKIRNSIEKRLANMPFSLVNDVVIALSGALNGESGINIIAGTGSIGLALDKSFNSHRVGGWGHFLGDEGSAYWIGLKLLNIFTKQADGRLEKTPLYYLIKDQLALDNDYNIITFVNQEIKRDRGEIAKFAKTCSDAAGKGDKYALEIFDQAGYELSRLIISLEKHFDRDEIIKVSYTGGVFKSKDLILKPLEKFLDKDRFKIQAPIYPPDIGAGLLAKKEYLKILKD